MTVATTQDNTPIVAVTIQWNSPTDTGNGLPIQNYTISTIPEIDYSVTVGEEVCSDSSCSHTFTVDGRDDNVMFNTPYVNPVSITANNTCDMESDPATGTGTVVFVAHSELYTHIISGLQSHLCTCTHTLVCIHYESMHVYTVQTQSSVHKITTGHWLFSRNFQKCSHYSVHWSWMLSHSET